MSILEELHKEKAQCEEELQSNYADLSNIKTRIACCEEKKAMLEKLITLASAEQEKADKAKAKQTSAKPAAPRKTPRVENKTPVINTTESAVSENSPTTDSISTRELAERLGVATTVIAKTCTDLGFNLEMIDNKYMLTKEQRDAVAKHLCSINA